ncbi:hypothetical protein HEP81_08147 (plasmid) [Streptomyces griseofuscus]|uniref:Uncharacterized protein n=1 Tax=Streptomyces griseofuscus TaxID=146922 RepID=A0A7H1QDJ5_9ACTN|nr:hypothetical protein [Streptomyces griseofuscus]QNT98375.1 hypothetical protein HEP81_08147 [Streptomyces griseofuscus]
MPEYLLNQQTRAVHEKADPRADEAEDGPEGPDQSLGGAGTEDAVELLARQAEAIRAQVTRHSTEHFMQRLAARLASDSKRPTRVQYASAGAAADADTLYPEEMPEVTQLAPPTSGPSSRTARPDGRPHLRPRSRRRRPTPINPFDPKASQYLAFTYVTELCSNILRSAEIDTLEAFAADYDEAGARTFGCLLYSLDKRESATYWWRFAAGAGDALAAHLLAAHHAATGPNADSRAWNAFSRMLGFRPDRHVPQPVRHRTELAPNFTRDIPVRQEARVFLRYPRLPLGLMTR